MIKLTSDIDESVNFIQDFRNGSLESRYVSRRENDFTCYLSTHSGCDKKCRFCWLTQTGQFSKDYASGGDIIKQAEKVLDHAATVGKATQVNYSFMSRGEPLSSRVILDPYSWRDLSNDLSELADDFGLNPTFNISSIFPMEFEKFSLVETFRYRQPTIYYSLYSFDEQFRRSWLPKAIDPKLALAKLKAYQDYSGKIVKVHGALIDGENDSIENWDRICSHINDMDLRVEYQMVRYNPHSSKCGSESSRIHEVVRHIRLVYQQPAKVIERVGEDVYASCGMFTTNT